MQEFIKIELSNRNLNDLRSYTKVAYENMFEAVKTANKNTQSGRHGVLVLSPDVRMSQLSKVMDYIRRKNESISDYLAYRLLGVFTTEGVVTRIIYNRLHVVEDVLLVEDMFIE